MKIKQGQVFTIRHRHYGPFKAIALRGFDTDMAENYPIAPLETVCRGKKTYKPWQPIPCHRGGVSRVIVD